MPETSSPGWAGAIAIDLLPAVLVFIVMVTQSAIRTGRGEGTEEDTMTVADLRAAIAAARALQEPVYLPGEPPPRGPQG
ncbi:hypothetical protein FALB51S_02266 [Frigidibacter albus]